MYRMLKYTWLFLILLSIGVNSAIAQQKLKFSVASFELDQFDMTAKNEQYKKIDGNGSPYAIIKVTSTNPDDDLKAYYFNFGNMNSMVEQHDDELWVYVQRNAKMVTISRQGYTTINKYDLQTTIEEGRTYVMQLSVTAVPVFTQMVQFSIVPVSSKAVVMVKSIKKDAVEELFGNTDNEGCVAKSLPYGSYMYRVVAENYHTSEGRFTLGDKTKTHKEKVTLRANFSEITLHVDAAADIYVNGEKKGNRTWKGILKAGSYQVECRQTNHKSSSQYITVEENDNRTIELTSPTPITGTLAVTSRPASATISIDGKDYGVTPRNINGLIIGRHTVTLSRQNYKSENLTVEITEGQTTNLDVTLSDIARMTIDSRPIHATLYVDGKNVGSTPYIAEMASGDYTMRLTHHKYHDFEKRVHLDSSHPNVTLLLDRQYQLPSVFYIQTGMQLGNLMGAEATMGVYISNFNIEGTFLYGLDKSETVYWNYTGGLYARRPIERTYTAMAYGGKVGYGIIIGTRWRITPQVGALCVTLKDDGPSKANVISGTAGARADFSAVSGFGLFIAPEMAFAVSKSNTYKQLESVSSKIKEWGSGFNVRLGISITL